MGTLWTGTSGYRYWPGDVYPPKTSSDQALRLYADVLPSVELNRTFYQLPRASTITKFQSLVPRHFVWSVKIWRRISHEKSLLHIKKDWTTFLARVTPWVVSPGVLLLQLPKRFPFDPDRLESFLRLVPSHIRLAVEFRENRWFAQPIYRLLKKHHVALVSVGAPGVPCVLDVQTAPFSYYRLHGPREWYKDAYSAAELTPFANAARQALTRGDVYVYFDNTIGGHAYWNAQEFQKRVSA